MRYFPAEFSDLLSRQGLRLLNGTHPLAGKLAEPRTRFLALDDLLAPARIKGAAALLEHSIGPHLRLMEQPIPPESIWEMQEDYAELLPKTMRQRTLHLDAGRSRGRQVAEEIGLLAMLRSESYQAFAAALAGRPLRRKYGLQAIAYGPGDYAGPHNDHHPEEPLARHGYLDMHIGFVTPNAQSQLLVYAKAGHFTEWVETARNGLLTAYRLPFWHYTTPLIAKPKKPDGARRWILLGTFLFKDQSTKA
ncbi:hypothetical protein [Ferrovibrio sp.]|uniref:hypothetical protein n=1 Tax=Ferrovibrio sp. TaxID=1917215 RepID=UPI0035AEFAB6